MLQLTPQLIECEMTRINPFCPTCPNQENGFLSGQSHDCRSRFSQIIRQFQIPHKGSFLFHQGQPATCYWFICKGMVKITYLVEYGEEVILDLLAPCCLVSGYTNPEEAIHSHSAITVSQETVVGCVRQKDWRQLVACFPDLQSGLNADLEKRLNRAYRLVGSMKYSVEERLIFILARFIELVNKGDHQKEVEIPISFAELAQFVQTSPESVSRTLRNLQAQEVIQIKEKQVLFIKEDRIRKYLGEE